MKIDVVKTLPNTLYVAFSGGVDSVVMAHVARKRKIDLTLAFYHHGNEYANKEVLFVKYYADKYDYKLITMYNDCKYKNGDSREKFWRDSRYNWFKALDGTVATGHNLDDAVEWYLMTALRGEGHYMEYAHSNVVRPLLTTSKKTITEYAKAFGLEWLEDPSNSDESFTERNNVRKNLVPMAVSISPGLYNIVKKRCHEKAHSACAIFV